MTKVRYDLVDPEAIHGIAQAFTFGQEKGYDEYSWRDLPVEKYISAYQRHMFKHLRYVHSGDAKQAFDDESGLLHIDHATANLNILRWFATQDAKIKKRMEKNDD